MSTRNLDAVFAPSSVALVGGSPRELSVGRAILRNLRDCGFAGPIVLVNPDYAEIDGVTAAATFAALSVPVDLAVVTAPAEAIPQIVEDAGAAGVRAAIVVTRGLGNGPQSIRAASEDAATRHGLRLVGPGCLGIQSPRVRLNASFAAAARPGDLALLSQSGGVMASTVEWADARGIGFSGVVSFGDMADVDVDDLLDYFAVDRHTRAILLYLEAVVDAPRFLSAARAAARIKPVVAIKTGGRAWQGRAGSSHVAGLVSPDAVYDAAFRRAGLLRVADLPELFAAAETLAHVAPIGGKRIAIVANSGGLGALAADRLSDRGGELAKLSLEARAKIDAALPEMGAQPNPVDLREDATPDRYEVALDAALSDRGVDAALAIHAPTSLSHAAPCAEAIVAATRRARARSFPPKPVFAAFLGAEAGPRAALEAAHVPFFRTPETAVAGLMHLVRHVEAQNALLAAPPSAPETFSPDVARARAAVMEGLANGRDQLSPTDVAEVLGAYAIPILPQALVSTPEEAAEVAKGLMGPSGAVLKIVSQDIPHKAAVGGVRLALESPEAVEEAARSMLARVAERAPLARIDGFLIQPHVRPPDGEEIFVGLMDDAVFGPVVAFGAGGGATERMRDVALGLPPLHMGLAHDLIDRTRAGAMLAGFGDQPRADRDAVALVLVKVAQLAADMPEIQELDINPLVATPRGVIALDARIRVAPAERSTRPGPANPRLAIRPYPKELESSLTLGDGSKIAVRPVRPEDEPAVAAFFRKVEPDDLRQRFFTPVEEVPRAFIARMTQSDYARAISLLAVDPLDAVLGIVQLHIDPDGDNGEYAILLRSDLKGRGLGWRLMRAVISLARQEGLSVITGQVLTENRSMLAVCRELGFEIAADPEDTTIRLVTLRLEPRPAG